MLAMLVVLPQKSFQRLGSGASWPCIFGKNLLQNPTINLVQNRTFKKTTILLSGLFEKAKRPTFRVLLELPMARPVGATPKILAFDPLGKPGLKLFVAPVNLAQTKFWDNLQKGFYRNETRKLSKQNESNLSF